MKTISTIHIKLQFIAQVLVIAVIILTYAVIDLLVVRNPDPVTNPWPQDPAWIDALRL